MNGMWMSSTNSVDHYALGRGGKTSTRPPTGIMSNRNNGISVGGLHPDGVGAVGSEHLPVVLVIGLLLLKRKSLGPDLAASSIAIGVRLSRYGPTQKHLNGDELIKAGCIDTRKRTFLREYSALVISSPPSQLKAEIGSIPYAVRITWLIADIEDGHSWTLVMQILKYTGVLDIQRARDKGQGFNPYPLQGQRSFSTFDRTGSRLPTFGRGRVVCISTSLIHRGRQY
ncbi:hypothetical protein Tco_0920612 [Tanacetum coccineum]